MLDIIAFYIEMSKGKQKEWCRQYILILVRILHHLPQYFHLEAHEIWTRNIDT